MDFAQNLRGGGPVRWCQHRLVTLGLKDTWGKIDTRRERFLKQLYL